MARFHSLGDVVLASGLAVRFCAEGNEVEVATAEKFVPLFEGIPLRSILTPDKLREAAPYDRVVDLQANATSRRLLRGLGPIASCRSRSAARRWIVFWGRRPPTPRIPHAVLRYAEAAGVRSLEAADLSPRLVVTEEDRAAAQAHAWAWDRTGRPVVALAPGGSRKMKRWPAERYRGLSRALASEGWESLVFLEPDGTPDRPEEGIVRASLRAMKGLLARCACLVTNDSGVMHVAVGLGVPVVAIFGSTVREFGFAPLGERDRVIERDLACRPCAPHGARFCWLGGGDCLRSIGAQEVHAVVREILKEDASRWTGAIR